MLQQTYIILKANADTAENTIKILRNTKENNQTNQGKIEKGQVKVLFYANCRQYSLNAQSSVENNHTNVSL